MGYGKTRAPLLLETPQSFSARDEFDQAAGALTGKTLPLGGTWGSAGASVDYQLLGGGYAQRDYTAADNPATSAALETGRFAIAGSTSFTNVGGSIDIAWSSLTSTAKSSFFLRYTNTNNYVIATLGAAGSDYLDVVERVGGTTNPRLARVPISGRGINTFYTLTTLIDTSGRIVVWFFTQGSHADPLIQTQSANCATGGALASGTVGPLDFQRGIVPLTTSYDNFRAWVPNIPVVLNSGRTTRFLHDTVLRQNAAGTSEGRPPVFAGKHLTLPPDTRANRKRRIVVKRRRFDSDSGFPDTGLSDAGTGTLKATPRVLLVSK
jgi:hypothetical protein